jgi:lipopolysaccharide/colanic/teichoic acid biosynthesis glycosyltransferase
VQRLSYVSETTVTYEQDAVDAAVQVEHPAQSRATAIACRTLDVVVAAVALVALSPLLLVVALWIRLDTRGPALFRQERRGRDMQPFVVNKFRTMHVNTPNDEHVAYVQSLIAGDAERKQKLFKLVADERVTRAGRILRRTSIDELPQLVNVLVGNMSLVGPRPCLDYELAKYPPHAFGRFAVKPGITGLWQVSGRSQLGFDEMIALDVEYAARPSFWADVRILLRTLPVALLGRGAA